MLIFGRSRKNNAKKKQTEIFKKQFDLKVTKDNSGENRGFKGKTISN